MKFKEWFTKSGMTYYALGRLCFINRQTVKNLVEGKKPYYKTVNKLIKFTMNMPQPISRKMFGKIKGEKKLKC